MEITIEQIKNKVSSDPRWATRAIEVLFERQTSDEQTSETTKHSNSIGFNGADAFILSSFAKQIKQGRKLSQKQLVIAYKKLPKYAKQLLSIAQEKSGEQVQGVIKHVYANLNLQVEYCECEFDTFLCQLCAKVYCSTYFGRVSEVGNLCEGCTAKAESVMVEAVEAFSK